MVLEASPAPRAPTPYPHMGDSRALKRRQRGLPPWWSRSWRQELFVNIDEIVNTHGRIVNIVNCVTKSCEAFHKVYVVSGLIDNECHYVCERLEGT